MDSDSFWLNLFILIVLIIISGLSSGAEVALISLSEAKVNSLVKEKRKNAWYIKKLLSNKSKLLITILIINNVVNIAIASLSTALAISLFGNKGIGIATFIVTFFILLFGEITPKSISSVYNVKVAQVVAKPLYWSQKILKPIILFFEIFVNFISKYFNPKYKDFYSSQELIEMANIHVKQGKIQKEEAEFIENILDFSDTIAEEIMIPKSKVSSLKKEMSIKEIFKLIKKDRFSRYPVYKKDKCLGILLIKDLILIDHLNNINDIKLFPAFKVPYCRKISDLFKDFKKNRLHMAIVVNDIGDELGIITMEDILEEIVGDISDETDLITNEKNIKQISKHNFLAKGEVTIEDINKITHLEIDFPEHRSLNALILEKINRFPISNEKININKDLTVQIKSIEESTIKSVVLIISS